MGGKIILPAPMKSAKVIKPNAIISRVRRFVIEGELSFKKGDIVEQKSILCCAEVGKTEDILNNFFDKFLM